MAVFLYRKNRYIYATAQQPKNTYINKSKRYLAKLFKDFAEPVPSLIAAANESAIMQHDLYDIKPLTRYYQDNMLLIGDAAHAMTPNLGQGAAQAIEDAAAISYCLKHHATPQDAFKAFEAIRHKKLRRLIQRSWQLGQLSTISHPLLCQLRNSVLKAIPSFALKRQRQFIMKGLR